MNEHSKDLSRRTYAHDANNSSKLNHDHAIAIAHSARPFRIIDNLLMGLLQQGATS